MDLTTVQVAALISMVLVPVASFIKKEKWSFRVKHLVGLGAALVAAVVGSVLTGTIHNVSDLVAGFGVAYTAAQVLYSQYFANTSLNKALEKFGN